MIIERWPAKGLINELKETNKIPERHFVFVLGAGASRTSGIPTGAEMAHSWLERWHARVAPSEKLAAWATATTLGIEGFDYAKYAEFYPQIFQKTFDRDRSAGYATLEDAMEGKRPSLGYTLLAQVMSTTRHNAVITTNFDNLVADALASAGGIAPMVCGHESLATYARVRAKRPLILKIHRDLFLNPINDSEGVGQLHSQFAEALKIVLKNATLVVLGYGGNDGSLMGFLDELPKGSIAGGVFWCARDGKIPPNSRISPVLEKHSGVIVSILDFDSFALELAEGLLLGFNAESVPQAAKARGEADEKRYGEQLVALKKMLNAPATAANPEQQSAAEALDKAIAFSTSMESDSTTHKTPKAKPWYRWELEASAEPDSSKKQEIYEHALKALPESSELHGNFAIFLTDIRKNHDAAEVMFKKTLALDPIDPVYIGNYASFLTNSRNDHHAAEVLYKQALSLDPNHPSIICNYANLLTNIHKDHDAAEALYKKAFPLAPNNPQIAGNYANYLTGIRKDHDAAEALYKKALVLDPNNADITSNYASFLNTIRKDYDASNEMYRKALVLDPNNGNILVNYASLLLMIGQLAQAKLQCWKAIQIDHGQSQISAEALVYLGLASDKRSDSLRTILSYLKYMLKQAFARGNWDFSSWIDKFGPTLPEGYEPMMRAVAAAIADPAAIQALDAFPEWRDLKPTAIPTTGLVME
jgi:protein O-mannosyl-transferase